MMVSTQTWFQLCMDPTITLHHLNIKIKLVITILQNLMINHYFSLINIIAKMHL